MNFNPTLKRFSRRIRFLRAWVGLGIGLSAGAILATGWAALDWLNIYYTEWSYLGWLVGACGVLGLLIGAFRGISAKSLTDSIDRRADLKNRLSTASERATEHGAFDDLLREDANSKLHGLRPSTLYPIKVNRWHGGALVFSLLAACLFMLGNTPLLLSTEEKAAREKMKEQAAQVERVVKPLEKEAKEGNANEEEKKLAKELKKLAQELKKARMEPEEAMQKQNELSKQAEKLEQERLEQAKEQMETAQAAMEKLAMEKADKQDEKSKLEQMKAQAELLKQLQKEKADSKEKMNSLQNQLNSPNLSAEQRQALQQLLDQMKFDDQQMQNLAQQMQQQMTQEMMNQLSELAKEAANLKKEMDKLKEQLENPNLSNEERMALEKKLADLQKKLSKNLEMTQAMKDAMDKMMKDPLMKEIMELAAKAEIIMQKGQEASQNGDQKQQEMTKAEMEAMMKQMDEFAKKLLKDDKLMKEYLEAIRDMLKNGKLYMCNGQCKNPFGLKIPLQLPMPGGPSKDNYFADTGYINKGPGRDGKGETFMTKVTGQSRNVPGETTYIEMRGPTGQGLRSSIPYKKVLPSYKSKADQAMNRQEIPPEHQKRVKKYFESLGQ